MVDTVVDQRYWFKINGMEIEVTQEKLLAYQILELAKEHGAIPGKPEDYELQGLKRVYKLDDWVNVAEDDEFITIPTTPTQVA